jgi:hypothetical protein
MENQEQKEEGTGKREVQIKCNERTLKIIQEMILPNREDPFYRSVMASIEVSATHGLPVNITVCGDAQAGRIAFVANSLCVMVTAEQTDKNGKRFSSCIGETVRCKDGKLIAADDIPEGEIEVLQFSVPCTSVMQFIAAMVSSLAPTVAEGCAALTELNITPDEEEGPTSEVEEPVPFAPLKVVPEATE